VINSPVKTSGDGGGSRKRFIGHLVEKLGCVSHLFHRSGRDTKSFQRNTPLLFKIAFNIVNAINIISFITSTVLMGLLLPAYFTGMITFNLNYLLIAWIVSLCWIYVKTVLGWGISNKPYGYLKGEFENNEQSNIVNEISRRGENP